MTSRPKMSAWRLLARAIYWNPDPFLRVANWLNFVNIALMFSPWRNEWCLIIFPMCAVALCGVALIRMLRSFRREKAARRTLEEQGGFWATEMAKQFIELWLAEQRHATQAEKDEITARFDEAKDRWAREIFAYQKAAK